MRISENSVTYQFIGNVTKGGDGLPADILDLPEGSVALVNENNTVMTTAAVAASAGTRVRVAQRANGEYIFSPYFTAATGVCESVPYVAPTQQVTYLGFNGTDGQLDQGNALSTYTLGIVLQQTQGVLNNTPMIKTIPAYNGTDFQYTLAENLLFAFNRTMAHENRPSIICERIVDSTALTEEDTRAVALVRGSSAAIVAVGVPNAASTTVGDYLYFEVGGDNVAYKITAWDAASRTYTLDAPWTGVSATIAVTDWGSVDNADNNDFGLRFTGVAINNASFNPVTENHIPATFKLTWERIDAPAAAGADPTTISYDTAATTGVGTYPEVAVMEVYTTMNEGNAQVSSYPSTNYRGIAGPASDYDTFVINATDTGYTSATTGQRPISKFTIYVRQDDNLDNAATEDDGQFADLAAL